MCLYYIKLSHDTHNDSMYSHTSYYKYGLCRFLNQFVRTFNHFIRMSRNYLQKSSTRKTRPAEFIGFNYWHIQRPCINRTSFYDRLLKISIKSHFRLDIINESTLLNKFDSVTTCCPLKQ